ncbi:MAG: sel1 repeat family protein [Deltaproteobacteria bacterium]|nr:sel1 repeat family protein [Deltaproteobacteria bacterium]
MIRINQTGLATGSLAACRKAALEGDIETMYRLGRMYEVGLRVPCDREEAAHWYFRAARRGHAKAQFRLGRMYASGRGLSRDLQQASSWLRLAAEQCVFGARRSYLNVLKKMEQQAPHRKQETSGRHEHQPETRPAAAQKHPRPMPEPSRAPRKQPPVRQRTSRFPFALLVFLLIAAFQIGNALLDFKSDSRSEKQYGKSSTPTARSAPTKPKAPPQAKQDLSQTYVKALIRLAEQGNAKAQYSLGILHGSGKILPQNNEQAVFWYHKAAQQGYAPAQYNLGWMYEQGRGVAQNGEQALFWYRKAAEQGFQKAWAKIDALQKNSP